MQRREILVHILGHAGKSALPEQRLDSGRDRRKDYRREQRPRAEARPEGSVSPAEWERGQVRGGGHTPETMQMEQHGRILKRELSKKINNRREETRSTTQLCLYTFCKNTYRGIYIKHITRIYEKQYNMMVKSTNSSSMCI